jgi:NAD(P)-dependent dehydrogenase (short-subunit alcohol dehydrogenase family)
MIKELIIFGSNGALGKGVTKSLLKKDYNKYYLFDFNFDDDYQSEKILQIKIEDLSLEENVQKAFKLFQGSKEKSFFLFSTVGGFTGGKTVWETDTGEWDKMMNMNLKSNFLIAKYFARLVKNSHSGSVCFTAAYTGLSPDVKKAAYGASKGALIHLVETIAKEGAEINLTANAIAPLIIDTPANRNWLSGANFENWMKPEEIGEFIYSIFNHYYFLTGNIFKLTHRFNVG